MGPKKEYEEITRHRNFEALVGLDAGTINVAKKGGARRGLSHQMMDETKDVHPSASGSWFCW
jgi:hypothetical protein